MLNETDNNNLFPAIILVQPQLGENIGAAARVMLNFGFRDLRLCAPRDGWPNQHAIAMASGAGRLLDHAQVTTDLRSALVGINFAMATTARERDLVRPILTPQDAVLNLFQRSKTGQRTAIVFGPERSGLTNTDVASTNALIAIPVNPQFKSLNLAQSVAVICYEWMRTTTVGGKEAVRISQPLAEIADKAKFVDLLVEELEQTGYFYPPEKAEGMRLNLRGLFMRMDLTSPELRTLHGVRRALARHSHDAHDSV